MKPWSVEIWRTIAIIALAASTLLGAVVVYSAFAFKSNLSVILEGAPICLKDAKSFDSIAAAQAIGRLDLVSFLLTTGGIMLGLFSLMGFWIIRREARDEAREAAAEEVRKIAQLYFKNQNGNGTNGGDKPQSVPHNATAPAARTTFDPANVSIAGAVEETGAKDDRPKRRSRRNPRASTDDSSADR